jgi:hypothetical protein
MRYPRRIALVQDLIRLCHCHLPDIHYRRLRCHLLVAFEVVADAKEQQFDQCVAVLNLDEA